MYTKSNSRKAFTLLEVAFVLVVVGLLVTGGLSFYSVISKVNRNNELRQQLNFCKEAIIGSFLSSSQYMLPANGANYSISGNLCISRTSDINFIRYIPYFSLSGSSVNLCSQTPSANLIRLVICNDAGCSSGETINDVAFVLISPGVNDNVQVSLNQTNREVRVYRRSVTVDGFTLDFSRNEEFDDIYMYETLNTLRAKAGCRP